MRRTPREAAGTPRSEKSSSATTNYYAVMGVQDFAKGSIAKRAYHRLALEWHPDRQVHASENRKKEAEDVFKKINEAYAVLSDSTRRKEFDLALRSELLGMSGGTSQAPGSNHGPKPACHTERSSEKGAKGGSTRRLLCPECGTGAEVKAAKRGGPSLQCHGCTAFFHEVYCAGCRDWGATKGRRGESTMRCGCGNIFCQSRCPSCSRWNTFNGEAQGGRTRSCGFCGCKFHEAFCPGCSGWGVWKGKKGCRSLSCDCDSLFYEISCQSCGMWGSVKGRHADAENSLRCGTCGSESHEAFCPSCRQWDSFAGSKGETTLVCKSPRCRGGQGGKSAGKARFFQVFCESCACWRSVLGDKSAVGTATIRCEGCKSVFRGATCPACGNWDQLLPPPQQQQKHGRATRFKQRGRGQDGCPTGPVGEDIERLPVARRRQCTSCGHQPPVFPDGDNEPSAEDTSTATGVSLTGVSHEGAGGVGRAVSESLGVATPRTGTTTSVGGSLEAAVSAGTIRAAVAASQTHPTAVGSKPPAPSQNDTRQLAPSSHSDGNSKGRGSMQAGSLRGSRRVPYEGLTPAPVHGMSVKPPASLHSKNVPEDASFPTAKFKDDDPACGAGDITAPDDGSLVANSSNMWSNEKSGDEDEMGNDAGRLAAPPGLTGADRNAHIDDGGPLPSAPILPARTATPRAAHAPPRSRSRSRRQRGRRPSMRGRRPATSSASTASETGAALGMEASTTPSARANAGVAAKMPADATGVGVGFGDGGRDAGGRDAEAVAAGVAPPLVPLSPAGGDDAGRTTFTAVPRESSPPPPPGTRIGRDQKQTERDSAEGSRRNAEVARGQGQEVVHLAFCSRCQEYQSWKAVLRGSGCWRRRKESSGAGNRRHCTECGDPYCNISYYPVR